jgi:cyclophilin family peptidyl-prolyl cis-trans isomerase
MNSFQRFLLPFALLTAALPACWAQNPVVVLETSKGTIEIELYAEAVPKTVENFLKYVDADFYADTVFHRVIRGFVIQGGGFTPELDAKPTMQPIRIEAQSDLLNERGTVAMARTDERDSATSQFFINVADNTELDHSKRQAGYTVFGRVISGMDIVDAIADVQTSTRGRMKDVPILPVFLDRAYRK